MLADAISSRYTHSFDMRRTTLITKPRQGSRIGQRQTHLDSPRLHALYDLRGEAHVVVVVQEEGIEGGQRSARAHALGIPCTQRVQQLLRLV